MILHDYWYMQYFVHTVVVKSDVRPFFQIYIVFFFFKCIKDFVSILSSCTLVIMQWNMCWHNFLAFWDCECSFMWTCLRCSALRRSCRVDVSTLLSSTLTVQNKSCLHLETILYQACEWLASIPSYILKTNGFQTYPSERSYRALTLTAAACRGMLDYGIISIRSEKLNAANLSQEFSGFTHVPVLIKLNFSFSPEWDTFVFSIRFLVRSVVISHTCSDLSVSKGMQL